MTAFSGFAALLPVLIPVFGFSNAQAGLISGVVLGGYMAGVPFLGALSDRYDPRRVYALSAAVAAGGGLGFAFLADGFWSALVCQTLIGLGLAGTYIPGMKALTDRLAGAWQARGAAIYGAVFGVGTAASLILCGAAGAAFGWQMAFALAAAGPLAAAALMLLALAPLPPRPVARRALFDFAPALRNARVRPYMFAAFSHSWELHGTRAWLVAFLTYAAGLHGDEVATGGIALTAALILLLGPIASVSGNELALRVGRARVVGWGPAISALLSCAFGFVAGLPWPLLLAFAVVQMYAVGIDAGALTAGMVNATDPAHRGTTMALYSMIGFSSGFFAPALFGVVLDLAGGRANATAWGWAFVSLGFFAALGLLPARAIARREGGSR